MQSLLVNYHVEEKDTKTCTFSLIQSRVCCERACDWIWIIA